jgi:diphthamide synthase (EF-2-diphthine--ammonia ligase)
MSWVALLSGKKDWILSSQKAIDTCKTMKYEVATHRTHLAGEGGDFEDLLLNSTFDSFPVTSTTTDMNSTNDRHELNLGGFA